MRAMPESIETSSPATRHCVLCEIAPADARCLRVRTLNAELIDRIERDIAPRTLDEDAIVCRPCLADVRARRVLERLEAERGALSDLEKEVAAKAARHASIVTNLTDSFDRDTTLGQRIADGVARVGGSWPFVVTFLTLLGIWMMTNSWLLGADSFDPYPFILLNLVLSCIAALQAPIIMMSQNRQASRDRREADLDFRINLKSELEIAALHEKIDHLLHAQWEDLISLQQTQLELLEEIAERRGVRDSSP